MNKTDKTTIVKIGGSTLGQRDTTLEDIVELQARGLRLVVVHGGGKIVTEWLSKLGASTKFVEGERVTDETGLEVVTAVLAGLVNKQLVAAINNLGGRAAGISGVDGATLEGRIKSPELGYVGSVAQVNTGLLETLLAAGYVPVVSSIGLNSRARQGRESSLLNINADIAAGEIAAALGAEKLIFLTDVPGICGRDGALIPRLTADEADALTISGAASGGMIPKIRAGIRALENGNLSRIIDGRQPHALLKEIAQATGGTTLLGHSSTTIKGTSGRKDAN